VQVSNNVFEDIKFLSKLDGNHSMDELCSQYGVNRQEVLNHVGVEIIYK
jgi:hypothetical protein